MGHMVRTTFGAVMAISTLGTRGRSYQRWGRPELVSNEVGSTSNNRRTGNG
jgi:hypothetical protein